MPDPKPVEAEPRMPEPTDRELLELAAKAAGLGPIVLWGEAAAGELVANLHHGDHLWSWMPLTDDGDALRLAVKLGLCINFEECDGVDFACAVPRRSHQGWDEVCGDDPAAATRRAIVRAAAALARSTESKEKP